MISQSHIKDKPSVQPSFGNTLNNTPKAFISMEKEIWKDIPISGGKYQISNFGRIRSMWIVVNLRGQNKYTIVKRVKILTNHIDKDGYHYASMCFFGKYRVAKIHRLVAQAFIPNPENKPEVNHIDWNKQNNHYFNLEWVTGLENMAHAYDNGLKKGKILSASELLSVKELLKTGLSHAKIGARFGVSQQLISNINSGNHYSEQASMDFASRE